MPRRRWCPAFPVLRDHHHRRSRRRLTRLSKGPQPRSWTSCGMQTLVFLWRKCWRHRDAMMELELLGLRRPIHCTRHHHPFGAAPAVPDDYLGNTTVSITWITPFEARMSVFTTLALSTDTEPP